MLLVRLAKNHEIGNMSWEMISLSDEQGMALHAALGTWAPSQK